MPLATFCGTALSDKGFTGSRDCSRASLRVNFGLVFSHHLMYAPLARLEGCIARVFCLDRVSPDCKG